MNLEADLSAHTFKERINLREWVTGRISENSLAIDMYEFLENKGMYFKSTTPPAMQGILLPRKTMAFQCHTNSTHYLLTVQEERPDFLSELSFVSGLYGLKANNDCVPKDKRYFIDHHSFILHKNKVLDWTILNHPPKYYDVDQYFGIAFSPQIVLDAIDELVSENQKGPMVPLMVLKKKPHLS